MQRLSAYTILQKSVSRQPDADAIVMGNITITRAEFLERVTAFAGWLLHNGFTPGETTGICIRDEIGHLVSAMAVLCLELATDMSRLARDRRNQTGACP